jgi:hypothetical protein
VQEAIHNIIAQHFASSQRLERQWYSDNHPDSNEVQKFKSINQEGII